MSFFKEDGDASEYDEDGEGGEEDVEKEKAEREREAEGNDVESNSDYDVLKNGVTERRKKEKGDSEKRKKIEKSREGRRCGRTGHTSRVVAERASAESCEKSAIQFLLS
jgi:hypothetical protein